MNYLMISFKDDALTAIAVSVRLRPSWIISNNSNVILESLIAKYLPCLSSPISHAVLFRGTRHATKLPGWLLKSYDVFPHGKDRKSWNWFNFLGQQRNRKFSCWRDPCACPRVFLFRSCPRKTFCTWKSIFICLHFDLVSSFCHFEMELPWENSYLAILHQKKTYALLLERVLASTL